MQRICKPHLVDLLRYFDKRRTFKPRIRYASIRPKPALIRDLRRYFKTRETSRMVYLVSRTPSLYLPLIQYDLKCRRYLFDGIVRDIPRESRQKPMFSIVFGPAIVHFPRRGDRPSTKTAVDDVPMFQEPDNCAHLDGLKRI